MILQIFWLANFFNFINGFYKELSTKEKWLKKNERNNQKTEVLKKWTKILKDMKSRIKILKKQTKILKEMKYRAKILKKQTKYQRNELRYY